MPKIYAMTSPEVTEKEINHMELSRKLAGECMVLLENNGVLPLSEAGNVALYGNGARLTVKGGTGSGEVNSRMIVTIEEGLEKAGFKVTTRDWLTRFDAKRTKEKQEHSDWIKEMAKKTGEPEFIFEFSNPMTETAAELVNETDIRMSDTDTAIYVIARNSGEGADRYDKEGDYLPFAEELENLKILTDSYRKVIVVLNIGGVMELTQIKDMQGIGAILLMSQLGNIGGDALCDVLTGAVNPSGKLTDSWAIKYSDYPSSEGFSHNDENVDDEYYTDGIYVGYRYFDSFGVKPLYEFGYGKSYTTFQIETKQVVAEDETIKITAAITNTGKTYAGKEVVQVYGMAPDGTLKKPYQKLLAFQKTKLLAPGESEELTLVFATADMASYCEACASWVLERGSYFLRVGKSSQDAKIVAELILEETVKTEILKNLFADEMKLEEIQPEADTKNRPKEQPQFCITLNASQLKTREAVYQGTRETYQTSHNRMLTMKDILDKTCTVEELVSQLTVEELAELCVGTMRIEKKGSDVVGTASYCVPGAAGDTTSILAENRGIKNMILADGPAGLRLQPHFKTTKDGTILPGGGMMGDHVIPFDPNLNEDEVDDYYQYCTAIPIGWALAQSWNLELLEQAGDMVGEEMEQFHVDLWLAPALNIHRNPLCGRNFEYFSEDPLISGKAAAAITKGVQKHRGKGTTIKHFAANNQEDNRYATNSHVSERALREIYLKGFEIAVKEAQPLSIMTSYNLINGVHAANDYDLLQAAARDEWGFGGVVMTDWFTSQDMPMLTAGHQAIYPISASTGCIYAGNDIQMPGCQKNVDDIVRAVKEGCELDGYKISLADLQFNAANVIRIAALTSVY